MNAYLKIMTGIDYQSEDYKLEWEKAGTIYHQADEANFHQDYLKLTNTEQLHPEFIKEAIQVDWDATNETTLKNHRAYHNKTFTSMGSHVQIWMEENGPLSATFGVKVKMNLPAYCLRPENGIHGESRRSDEEKELTLN